MQQTLSPTLISICQQRTYTHYYQIFARTVTKLSREITRNINAPNDLKIISTFIIIHLPFSGLQS